MYIELIFLWILFYGTHSLLASSIVKLWVSVNAPSWVAPYRVFYNLVSVALFLWAFWVQKGIAEPAYFSVLWLQYLGYFLMAFGAVLSYLSFKNYSLQEFSGLSQLRNKSFNAAISEELKILGLNQYVRHPLYTASYLIFIGYFLYKPCLGSAIFSILGAVYLYVGAKWEEQKLVAQFGQAYIEYQKQVPMFVPFI
ncbi:MAG: isoprenylcysteine carboxylmethyltransferase family protein [bacterium]|nr:isoprenylcysteine carboxylmethyltransferase family protein [bacterium]